MIKISNNELQLNDGTFYDLSKTSKKRVLQGLNQQLQDGSLTKDEYEQCIKLIAREEAATKLKGLGTWIAFNKDYIKFDKPCCENCGLEIAVGNFIKDKNNIVAMCDKCKTEVEEIRCLHNKC